MAAPKRPIGPRPVRGQRLLHEYVDENGDLVMREARFEESRLREDEAGVDLETVVRAAVVYSCGCPQTKPLGLQCQVPGCGRQSCNEHVSYCDVCQMPLCRPHAAAGEGGCPRHAKADGTPWGTLARYLKGRRHGDPPPNTAATPPR